MTDGVDIVLAEIRRLRREKGQVIVAIDGRCASGKTTMAGELQAILDCNVIHMDDFFLREEQRTPERYAEPGGNVDRERFFSEVLQPLLRGEPFSYRPFDCHEMKLSEPVPVTPGAVNIIEGTYSCHPAFWDGYDLRVFLTTSRETQLMRIGHRDPAKAEMFRKRWIPLEERYFAAFGLEEKCEIRVMT